MQLAEPLHRADQLQQVGVDQNQLAIVIAPWPTRRVASSRIAATPLAITVTSTMPTVLRKRSDLTVSRSTSASEPS